MPITVKDLKKLLENVDDDRIVVLSSDPEGNSYSPFRESGEFSYDEYQGEVGLEELTKELIEDGYSENDLLNGQPALVLYP